MDIFGSANYAAKKTAPKKIFSSIQLFPYGNRPDAAIWNKQYIVSFHVTGSRYICTPPVTNTDEDYIVLIKDETSIEFLKKDGFIPAVNDAYGQMKGGFISFRKGDINLIVTSSTYFYNNFIKATQLAKEFNLTDKKHRIMLFEAMRAGKVNKSAKP